MSDSDYRMPAKRWKRRNSDGRDTFEGARSQDPPGFTLAEYPLPADRSRLTAPDDPDQATALRHTHVWDELITEA